MNRAQSASGTALAALGLAVFASCMGGARAMSGYYANHPEMMARLLRVRTIYIPAVRGEKDPEKAAEMRGCVIDELGRRGRGRFRIASSPAACDAVMEVDMSEELGPIPSEEPLPFTLETELVSHKAVYARMKLTDPKTGRLIYKTDTKEWTEFEVDTIPRAAYTVVKNLMKEIEHCRTSIAP